MVAALTLALALDSAAIARAPAGANTGRVARVRAEADSAAVSPAGAEADSGRVRTPADSAAIARTPARADSERVSPRVSPRVVVRLQEFVVEGAAIHDPLSSETVHLIPAPVLRALPVDRFQDLVSLQAGVVTRGENLYVRGGRAGELTTQLQGVVLNEPLRGRLPEIPLIAIRDAELVSGGQDAEFGGGLAGVLSLRTVDPGERWGAELRSQTDFGLDTHYDRVAGRLGGPIPVAGLGVSLSLEAALDDTYLPSLRTDSRRDFLAGSFGWRADNRLSGHFKLATRDPATRVGLEVLASRRVDRPYDPMWTLDGYTIDCVDPPNCTLGPTFSPDPAPGFQRYRAADHVDITNDRRMLSILSWQRASAVRRASVALAWAHAQAITSLNGLDDESYLAKDHAPEFGMFDSRFSDPFLNYRGDEPLFRKTRSDVFTLRADFQRETPRGNMVKIGAGVTYDQVEKRELDVSTYGFDVDSLRAFRAFAPGGFAYAQGRWVFEGMVANAGLRAEHFSAGPQAEEQTLGGPARSVWSLLPRLGVAYPISVRDVLSLSYARLRQAPGRDYLYDNRTRIANRRPMGNPALVPATATSWQMGIKHLFSRRWSLQGSVFYRDLWGLIGARDTRRIPDEPELRYKNVDDANAAGFELTVIRAAGESGRLELDYTWQQAVGTYSREQGVPFGPLTRRRPESVGDHPLDWDRRHSLSLSGFWQRPGTWSASWATIVGSPLPWTPSQPGQNEPDFSRENSRRLDWEENTSVSVQHTLARGMNWLILTLEVRNLFDHRGQVAATLDGYPNPFINTLYDDYSAFKTQTGLGGGGYYDDRDGNGQPGWVTVHDPRLASPPRAVRLGLRVTW